MLWVLLSIALTRQGYSNVRAPTTNISMKNLQKLFFNDHQICTLSAIHLLIFLFLHLQLSSGLGNETVFQTKVDSNTLVNIMRRLIGQYQKFESVCPSIYSWKPNVMSNVVCDWST